MNDTIRGDSILDICLIFLMCYFIYKILVFILVLIPGENDFEKKSFPSESVLAPGNQSLRYRYQSIENEESFSMVYIRSL